MDSSAIDLATVPASRQQRRTALIVLISLAVIGIVTAPFAHLPVGMITGFMTLYGGAAFMGIAITTIIIFAQFNLSRRPSMLVLACGLAFIAVVFIPYILTYPGGALPSLPNLSAHFWVVWHTALPLVFIIYAIVAYREGSSRVDNRTLVIAILLTLAAAYVACHLVYTFNSRLPPLVRNGEYLPWLYAILSIVAVASAVALMLLLRGGSVMDAWLTVPAGALLIESMTNLFGGVRHSVGWYLARFDVLVATTFLVVILLLETNRLSYVLAQGERRLRGIVGGVTDALIVVDARGSIVSVNPAAAELFGFAAEDLEGTPITRLLPDFANVADWANGAPVETTGRDIRDAVFPIELACGRDTTGQLDETIVIVRDITQRKRAEEAIRAAHDRAIEAADVKAQFLATMSHEIRTPINAVVGMSELLLQTNLDEEGREYATTVRDSAESLLAIVNDILDFSKIEAGHMELEAVPFSPVVAVENATDILATAARKKGLSLSTYIAPDVPRRVIGDADRLRQVLLNLLGNAVKFTSSGSVTVRAVVDHLEGENAVLHFSVSDTGPGIAPDVAERLFEPFRQADQSTRRRFGGTGLGLSISRRIVELMGGRIGFDSSVGRGSTFWFTVPLPKLLEDDRQAADPLRGTRILVVDEEAIARQVIDQYLLSWGAVASSTGNAAHALELARALTARQTPFDAIVIDRRAGGDGFGLATRLHSVRGLEKIPLVLVTGAEETQTTAEARARGFVGVVRKPIRQVTLHDALVAAVNGTAAVSQRTPHEPEPANAGRDSIRVLVVEDNPVNRKLALQQLKKLGYGAHAVGDGSEAVAAVARGEYDLVLMDCQMPDVDGFEATRRIRRAEAAHGGHIPIVAMTANALEGDREECLAAGMDDYLAKPVQLGSLRAAIERFVNGIGVAG